VWLCEIVQNPKGNNYVEEEKEAISSVGIQYKRYSKQSQRCNTEVVQTIIAPLGQSWNITCRQILPEIGHGKPEQSANRS